MDSNRMNITVSGGAGFIGSHLVDRLLKEGHNVTNIDNFDSFYNESIKRENIKGHFEYDSYKLHEIDLRDKDALDKAIPKYTDAIVHLAAKAGVRPSLEAPAEYQEVNVMGTQNLLEFARLKGITQFVFASSSSVYGVNKKVPWSETDSVFRPISPYASSKLSCEFLGHVYKELYGIRFIALRYFTVFGPRQRPDLAIHKFVDHIFRGEEITLYGDGSTRRDYTYIDDIVKGTISAVNYTDSEYEIINLGNDKTTYLKDLIELIEKISGMRPRLKYIEEQKGDVPQTWADISKAQRLLNYNPETSIEEGIVNFVEWFKENRI